MFDRYNRAITYLRISVTDRCNLRCVYCMPLEGVPLMRHDQILSLEEIRDVARQAVALGIRKIRLTGGEPLVRRGIVHAVALLAELEGIQDLAMTTNGILLEEFAAPLAQAGLHRVNVSLDAVEPARYAAITRGGDVARVLKGIAAARGAGLAPVKLNCVVRHSADEPDAAAVRRYAETEGLEVRFIRCMNLSRGDFSVVIGGDGGDCPRCNRLRLSSDGMLRPCLFSDLAFSVHELGATNAISQAVAAKPESGRCSHGMFHAIGG